MRALGRLVLLAVGCAVHLSLAQVLPAERRIDWSLSGIPGGIPVRSVVCASLKATATKAEIQAALDACPVNQVVKLPAGTFSIPGGLKVPSGVVLRGAGPQATILNASGSGEAFVQFGTSPLPIIASSTAISTGATVGSTSLTLASASGVSVGSYLMVTQLNDPALVTITTTNGTCGWCDGGLGWNGTRVQGQIVEVTSVNGSVVGISPGLYTTFSRTPLATPFQMGAKYSGV
jgi:hypothetical protein